MSPDSKIPARSSPPPLNTNFDDSQNNDESLETFLEELFAASQRQSQEPINVRPGSRTYNTYTYTAESPRPNAATPFPGRETEIGSSPDLSSIVPLPPLKRSCLMPMLLTVEQPYLTI